MLQKTKTAWLDDLVLLPREKRYKSIHASLEDNLLVSAPSKQEMPGGMYQLRKSGMFTPAELITIDTIETSGLWLKDGLFLRSLQSMSTMFLLAYSESGHAWTIVNEELKNVHDILIFEGDLYVASCNTNEVACVSMKGEIKERWKFGIGGHTWHINCLSVWDDRLVVTCFGRYDTQPPWDLPADVRPGHVFDVKTGEYLWQELHCPHTPAVDPWSRKFVCDSREQRVLVKEPDGKINEIKFPGTFPKALAWGKEKLYIGLAKFRGELTGVEGIDSARIAICDPHSFAVSDYIELPCSEMYNIIVLPERSALAN